MGELLEQRVGLPRRTVLGHLLAMPGLLLLPAAGAASRRLEPEDSATILGNVCTSLTGLFDGFYYLLLEKRLANLRQSLADIRDPLSHMEGDVAYLSGSADWAKRADPVIKRNLEVTKESLRSLNRAIERLLTSMSDGEGNPSSAPSAEALREIGHQGELAWSLFNQAMRGLVDVRLAVERAHWPEEVDTHFMPTVTAEGSIRFIESKMAMWPSLLEISDSLKAFLEAYKEIDTVLAAQRETFLGMVSKLNAFTSDWSAAEKNYVRQLGEIAAKVEALGTKHQPDPKRFAASVGLLKGLTKGLGADTTASISLLGADSQSLYSKVKRAIQGDGPSRRTPSEWQIRAIVFAVNVTTFVFDLDDRVYAVGSAILWLRPDIALNPRNHRSAETIARAILS